MTSSAARSDVIIATKDAISCDLNGEAVIMHLPTETYFGLDPTGAVIWNLVQQGRTLDDICERLMSEYDVPREQCLEEVGRLIDEMQRNGLVEVIAHGS
jgi:hypothetical protein